MADSFLSWIDDLTAAEREQLVGAMPLEEARSADEEWREWAHAGQGAPAGDWRTWVIMAGRGFGKTLAGSQWIASAIAAGADAATATVTGAPLRIALVGATLDEARRVMVEGRSGLLEVAGAWVSAWQPSLRRLRFTTGAEATLFSGAAPQALRGPEHHFAWCDELAKWEQPGECWDMLQLGLRLGEAPRALVTTTPRPGPVLRRIMASPGCARSGGSTYANPHLPDAFKATVAALYAGTRLGRQELEGELLTDTPGALWSAALIERCRVPALPHAGESGFVRILIGVDPPAGDGTCGIVACAKDGAGIGHVLADHSVTGRSPEGWARAVADAVHIHGAGLVVAESNQGGKMVRAVLHTADPGLCVRLVTATQGKTLRAEPVAHLFEAGKAVLRGRFPQLEAELLGMIAGGEYEGPGVSPDRADAMVWALTELMLGKERAAPGVRML